MVTWKITEKGEYKRFFGYTIVSMISDPERKLKTVEDFLSSSSISQYYAPLPQHSYHMTVYNIFAYNRDPIPAIKKWMTEENANLPDDSFLPEHVLKSQHALAIEAIKKRLGEQSLKIKDVALEVSYVIKVKVELENYQETLLKSLRKDLINIYEYPDETLKFHVTLAYLYKKVPVENEEFEMFTKDLDRLKEIIQIFKGVELNNPNVHLFDSMVNFMPLNSIYSM